MQTVTIHTRLITNVGGQTEKIQNTFKGTWGIRDNRHLLSYNEADNGGPTHVLFDMVQAELRRMGQVRSRMTFAERERISSRYITPMVSCLCRSTRIAIWLLCPSWAGVWK